MLLEAGGLDHRLYLKQMQMFQKTKKREIGYSCTNLVSGFHQRKLYILQTNRTDCLFALFKTRNVFMCENRMEISMSDQNSIFFRKLLVSQLVWVLQNFSPKREDCSQHLKPN